MLAPAFLLASLVTIGLASPAPRSGFVVRDTRDAAPAGFVSKGPASPDTKLQLRLGLFSSDMAGLEKALYDVSIPSSSSYGQHLSKEEAAEFAAPSADVAAKVKSWLSANSLEASTSSPGGDWMTVNIPVSKANELFNADFTIFTHEATGQDSIRTLSYSVPAELDSAMQVVHPTTAFAKPAVGPGLPVIMKPISVQPAVANFSGNDVPASCSSQITPACIQALYGVPTSPATQSSNVLAVTGYIQQWPQNADLQSFLTNFRPDINPSTTWTLQTLDGGGDPQGANDAGVEANLDTQYTIGIATGVPVTFVSVGDSSNDGVFGFLDTANALLSDSVVPNVVTTSYGSNEADLPLDVAQKLCDAYMQLGARGTSVLFSSGDGGVSGSQSGSCTNFVPTFPSGCPFMTSVGATTGVNPETAASFSSGGFSNYFGTPDYQASAVSSYLSNLGSTNAGLFNSSGRGFPDVSAQGENVVIFSGGNSGTVGGTSCSSPIMASIISLLNDELIAAGKSPLGFLNPFLYGNPSVFTDITSGDNPGCNTNGFPSTAGWDPVTGLGTPIYSALRTAAGL